MKNYLYEMWSVRKDKTYPCAEPGCHENAKFGGRLYAKDERKLYCYKHFREHFPQTDKLFGFPLIKK